MLMLASSSLYSHWLSSLSSSSSVAAQPEITAASLSVLHSGVPL